MQDTYFIPSDAHEGCVWVPHQQRLYFATTKKLDEPRVGICYLDFSAFDLARDADWGPRLAAGDPGALTARQFVHDANMANSLTLDRDGRSLLVAEQGDQDHPARLTRRALADGAAEVLLDAFEGQPLNSPNKVIVSRAGHVIVSDPDYGFRQGFRPPPVREPSLYVLPAGGGAPFAFDCGLEMPHGLALSPDETTLYVTDTSADGAHDTVDLERRRAVYAFTFDPASGRITNDPRFCFAVDKGVPDGTETDGDRLIVGGGDGVYVAQLDGKLIGKIKLKHTAVNLAVVYDHLFVTADDGVYVILNWRDRVR